MQKEKICTSKYDAELANVWSDIFPKNFKLIGSEISVYGDFGSCSGGRGIGSIDFMAYYNSSKCLIESKISNHNDFWNSFKILGYKEAYCIDNRIYNKTKRTEVMPMVMLNEGFWCPAYRNVLLGCGINYILVNRKVNAETGKNIYSVKSSLW